MLDSLRELASPAILSILTRQTNEPESAIARGFGAAIPAMAATIANRSDDHNFMKELTDLATSAATDSDPLKGVSRIASSTTGIDTTTPTGGFLSNLFGHNLSGMVDSIANYAGVRGSSAASILSVCAPLVLGYIGRLMRSENLTTAGLADRLRGQRNQLASAVPLGFEMPEFFHAPYRAARTAVDESARRIHGEAETSWTVPVVALLCLFGLGGLIWWANHKPMVEQSRVETSEPATQPMARPAQPIEPVKPVGTTGLTSVGTPDATGMMPGKFTRSLPGNVIITIPFGGAEDRLYNYLSSPGSGAMVINFDRIKFDSGSAMLSSEARDQIDNVATILRAYPNAHVTVVGYTDNTGAASANMALSKARADSVAGRLTADGVASERVHPEGMSSEKPVGDNATDAGRGENRHVALEVNQ
jgi:outer membrane protein OmpA-like peptidoglycan-associated protein